MIEPNKFYKDIREIIDHWKKFNPIRCHKLGIHDFDGLLPDYSLIAIENRIIELKEDIVHLLALKRDYSDAYTIFEFNLVKLTLEQELYELAVHKEYKYNPIFYFRSLTLLDQSFTVRSFASLNSRIEIITKFLLNIPRFLKFPKEHLIPSLPDIHLELATLSFKSLITFLQIELPKFVNQTTDKQLAKNCNEASKIAINSLSDFVNDLINNYKLSAHSNYSLGQNQFLEMLKKTEFVSIDINSLKKLGQDDLDRNFQKLQNILNLHNQNYLSQILNEKASSEILTKYANESFSRILSFIYKKQIVDIPSNEPVKVIETPESVRKYYFGGLNSPGPFESSINVESYFYITPPDPSWTIEQQQNYMKFFNKSNFELIAISQVYPGDFLKILFERYRTKSIISKLFSKAPSIIQGYPNYAQEMMIEENYNPWPEDPDKIKVGQLLMSLLRNVRFIVAIGIHCFDLTFEEGKKMFVEKAFLSEESAITETKRAIVDPMYINYTLGKLLIKKLRNDYKKERGENFTLKDFHNELLSYGSAPITLLRQVMLKDPKIVNEIL